MSNNVNEYGYPIDLEYEYHYSSTEQKGGKMKTGLLSTEFWVSLATAVIGALLALGYVPQNFPEAEVLLAVERIAGAIILIVTAMSYTKARTELKKTNGNNKGG